MTIETRMFGQPVDLSAYDFNQRMDYARQVDTGWRAYLVPTFRGPERKLDVPLYHLVKGERTRFYGLAEHAIDFLETEARNAIVARANAAKGTA